jgi:hypothetical protein
VADTGVAAAFFARLAATFFAAFRAAFTGAFFVTVFLAAGACSALAASVLTLAHRLLVASAMAFLPAAESFRFGLVAGATGDDGSDSFLDSAHRFRCASPMRLRAAEVLQWTSPLGRESLIAARPVAAMAEKNVL